jgi:stage V sporulation protein K
VGKTVMARLYAHPPADLRVLGTGTLVETDRAGLLGGSTEQTTLKTENVCADEAYALAVIAAGSAEPMQAFPQSNPGLPSGFTKTIEFPAYSMDELVGNFHGLAKAERLRVDPEGELALRQCFDEAHARPNFANARMARTLLERAREAQALRLGPSLPLGTADLTVLKWEDIETTTWKVA